MDRAPPGPASTTRLTPRRRLHRPWETIGQGIRPKPNGAPRSRAGLPIALAGRRDHQAGVRLVGRAIPGPQYHLPEPLAGNGGALVSHEFPFSSTCRPHCRTWRMLATGIRASSNRCQISAGGMAALARRTKPQFWKAARSDGSWGRVALRPVPMPGSPYRYRPRFWARTVFNINLARITGKKIGPKRLECADPARNQHRLCAVGNGGRAGKSHRKARSSRPKGVIMPFLRPTPARNEWTSSPRRRVPIQPRRRSPCGWVEVAGRRWRTGSRPRTGDPPHRHRTVPPIRGQAP